MIFGLGLVFAAATTIVLNKKVLSHPKKKEYTSYKAKINYIQQKNKLKHSFKYFNSLEKNDDFKKVKMYF